MKSLISLLIGCAAAAAGAETTRLAGVIRNTAGHAVPDLVIHFYQRTATGFNHLTATTMADGEWSIDLPPGEWRGAAHSDDILRRGYFCFPGFIWCGDDGGLCGGDPWPPLWGGGEIGWNPVPDPGAINLTIVPTRPVLTLDNPGTTAGGVKVTFETTAQSMTVIRQWRIEKSTDLSTWQPLQTVALAGNSPVTVPHTASVGMPACYYRAVQVEDLVPAGP